MGHDSSFFKMELTLDQALQKGIEAYNNIGNALKDQDTFTIKFGRSKNIQKRILQIHQ